MKSRRQEELIKKLYNANSNNNFYKQQNSIFFNKLIYIVSHSKDFKEIKSCIAKDSGLNQWICDVTPLLASEQYTLKTKLYWILFNVVNFPKCDNEKCGKPILKNIDLYQGYDSRSKNGYKYCCHQCSVSSLANRQQHIKTCLDRYGETSYSKTKQCKDKIKQTSLEKYGTINPGCSQHALAKARATNLKLYGTRYPAQTDYIKKKTKESFIQHYGVDNNMKCKEGIDAYQTAMQIKYGKGIFTNLQLESTKDKIKQTKLEKYGDENFCNHEKSKQTKYQKYGDENFNNRIKFTQTMMEKYGVENALQCNAIRTKSSSKYRYDGKYFDSSPEIAFYIWLKDNNFKFEYQPSIKLKYIYDNKEHFYMPDFNVNGQLIEIKGNQYLKNDGTWMCPYDHSNDALYEAKRKCAIANDVKILYSADYKKYLDYISEKYGKKYLKQFKK